jgi:hypothetical protein
VPGDQKALGVINAHATALHFIAMMRAARLAHEPQDEQRWTELLERFHPGTRALFQLLYPAYDPGNSALKYPGFLGYSLADPAMKEGNGVGYNDITYMAIVPGYLQQQDYELAFVDTAAAVRSDSDPLRPGAQPCPVFSSLGPLSRALPLVLSFIQFETFPDIQTYPGSFNDDNERAGCLDLTDYNNIEKWWEMVCSAYLMVSLQSAIITDRDVASRPDRLTIAQEEHVTKPGAKQAVFHKHKWWDHGKGWKNILNNLRLIIQPYVYYCLLSGWLELFNAWCELNPEG